jgi:hypothetical protein
VDDAHHRDAGGEAGVLTACGAAVTAAAPAASVGPMTVLRMPDRLAQRNGHRPANQQIRNHDVKANAAGRRCAPTAAWWPRR